MSTNSAWFLQHFHTMMSQSIAQRVVRQSVPAIRLGRELKTELIRKSIHLLIATVPFCATFVGPFVTLGLLAVGTLIYSYAEFLRQRGGHIPIISRVTELASRRRDLGHFVLGPVTLGIGAMLTLMLYPEPAASIAIYALAFGDGLASLVGKLFGRTRLLRTEKTVEGSASCFFAVLLTTYLILSGNGGSGWIGIAVAFMVALVATVVEALPLKDSDNLVMPAVVGLTAHVAVITQIF
jgi:dolichol kinase